MLCKRCELIREANLANTVANRHSQGHYRSTARTAARTTPVVRAAPVQKMNGERDAELELRRTAEPYYHYHNFAATGDATPKDLQQRFSWQGASIRV